MAGIAKIVIRINADEICFQIKGILAKFFSFQFIFMEVSPTPDFGIDNMWKTFPAINLIEQKKICHAQGNEIVDTYFKQNINNYFFLILNIIPVIDHPMFLKL